MPATLGMTRRPPSRGNDTSLVSLAGLTGLGPSNSFNIKGALGGFQLGYNWQFAPMWVAGLETDFDFANIKGNGTANYLSTLGGLPFNSTASENTKWFGTARARLGYLPLNNLLVFGTGGFAYGRVEQNASHNNASAGPLIGFAAACIQNSTCWTGSSTRTATGWTAGGGAEYAFMKNWTVKAEYLYVNLGSNNFTENAVTPIPGGGTSSVTASFSQTQFHIVRAGLNYRF